jgi:hypothetical protein
VRTARSALIFFDLKKNFMRRAKKSWKTRNPRQVAEQCFAQAIDAAEI